MIGLLDRLRSADRDEAREAEQRLYDLGRALVLRGIVRKLPRDVRSRGGPSDIYQEAIRSFMSGVWGGEYH